MSSVAAVSPPNVFFTVERHLLSEDDRLFLEFDPKDGTAVLEMLRSLCKAVLEVLKDEGVR